MNLRSEQGHFSMFVFIFSLLLPHSVYACSCWFTERFEAKSLTGSCVSILFHLPEGMVVHPAWPKPRDCGHSSRSRDGSVS